MEGQCTLGGFDDQNMGGQISVQPWFSVEPPRLRQFANIWLNSWLNSSTIADDCESVEFPNQLGDGLDASLLWRLQSPSTAAAHHHSCLTLCLTFTTSSYLLILKTPLIWAHQGNPCVGFRVVQICRGVGSEQGFPLVSPVAPSSHLHSCSCTVLGLPT